MWNIYYIVNLGTKHCHERTGNKSKKKTKQNKTKQIKQAIKRNKKETKTITNPHPPNKKPNQIN